MKKNLAYFSVLLLGIVMALILLFTPAIRAGQGQGHEPGVGSPRSECNNECTRRYLSCKDTATTNEQRTACQQAYHDCKDACRASSDTPTKSRR